MQAFVGHVFMKNSWVFICHVPLMLPCYSNTNNIIYLFYIALNPYTVLSASQLKGVTLHH